MQCFHSVFIRNPWLVFCNQKISGEFASRPNLRHGYEERPCKNARNDKVEEMIL